MHVRCVAAGTRGAGGLPFLWKPEWISSDLLAVFSPTITRPLLIITCPRLRWRRNRQVDPAGFCSRKSQNFRAQSALLLGTAGLSRLAPGRVGLGQRYRRQAPNIQAGVLSFALHLLVGVHESRFYSPLLHSTLSTDLKAKKRDQVSALAHICVTCVCHVDKQACMGTFVSLGFVPRSTSWPGLVRAAEPPVGLRLLRYEISRGIVLTSRWYLASKMPCVCLHQACNFATATQSR
jgi:hypothetical protein